MCHGVVRCVVATVLCAVVNNAHAQCGTNSVPYGIEYVDGSVRVLCGTFDCYNNKRWGQAVGGLTYSLASFVLFSHATISLLHPATAMASGWAV